MKYNPKDSRQIINLVSKLEFKETNIGDYLYLSDVIKVPVLIFNQPDENVLEILNSNKRFIETFCSALNDRFLEFSHDIDKPINGLMNGEIASYMNLVNELVKKDGTYANQYKLATELTHYTTSFMVTLRVGLKQDENAQQSLTPECVIGVNFEARNKFDKSLNKQFELFLDKLTVFTKDNDN